MSPESLRRLSTVAALFSLLSACGGGSGASPTSSPPPPPPTGARGDVVSAKLVGTLSTADIDAQTAIDPTLVNDAAHCGVGVVSITYDTIDPSGAPATAGMGLLVPDESACPGPHPLLSHQHGTNVAAGFDTASVKADSLAASMSALYASHGYVVVMPNYLGYAGSSVDWHAYLQAEPSAAPVIDAIRAARNWVAANQSSVGTVLNGDVYLSGTSQGGYVTLATQRTMERDFPTEFRLKQVAPTSGPYDVATTFLYFLTTPDSQSNPNATPAAMTLYGFQRAYGDVYTDPLQVFNTDWASEFNVTASVLIPGPYGSDEKLRTACKLPWYVKDTGGPVVGSCSNAPLLQAGFVSDYVNQTAAFSASGLAARKHADDNSLVHASGAQPWSPKARVTFCYGDIDPMATPNAEEAATLSNASAVDVQSDASEPAYIRTFMAAGASNADYHGAVEAPGCTSYTRNVLFPRLY